MKNQKNSILSCIQLFVKTVVLDNFIFEIIESFDTDDKLVVLKYEQELMLKHNSNLNTYRSFLTEEQKQQYRLDNIEQTRLRNIEKFTCACNGRYTRSHKAKHLRSKIHKKFEEQQIINNITNNITINFNITIQK